MPKKSSYRSLSVNDFARNDRGQTAPLVDNGHIVLSLNKSRCASCSFIFSTSAYLLTAIALITLAVLWKNSLYSPFGGFWSLLIVAAIPLLILGVGNIVSIVKSNESILRCVFIMVAFYVVLLLTGLAIIMLVLQLCLRPYVDRSMAVSFEDYADVFKLGGDTSQMKVVLENGFKTGRLFSLLFFLAMILVLGCAAVNVFCSFVPKRVPWSMITLSACFILNGSNSIFAYIAVRVINIRMSDNPLVEHMYDKLLGVVLIPASISFLIVVVCCALHVFFWFSPSLGDKVSGCDILCGIFILMGFFAYAIIGITSISFTSVTDPDKYFIVNPCLTCEILDKDNSTTNLPLVKCLDSGDDEFSLVTDGHHMNDQYYARNYSKSLSLSLSLSGAVTAAAKIIDHDDCPDTSYRKQQYCQTYGTLGSDRTVCKKSKMLVLAYDCAKAGRGFFRFSNVTGMVPSDSFDTDGCFDFSGLFEEWTNATLRGWDVITGVSMWMSFAPLFLFWLSMALYLVVMCLGSCCICLTTGGCEKAFVFCEVLCFPCNNIK